MNGLRLVKISIIALMGIVLGEMVYQYVLVPRMAVYPRRLPVAWQLVDLAPLLLLCVAGAACRKWVELLAVSVMAAGFRVVFEFIIAHRNWPGHLKSYAIEDPVYCVCAGLVFFIAAYLVLLIAGYGARCVYLNTGDRLQRAPTHGD